jgi:hypothetical protein
MKSRNPGFLPALVVFLSSFFWIGAYAQVTPSQDAFTNSASPSTNYGANVLLDVNGNKQTTYVQFDLSSIPSGANVSQATLKVYVNAVNKAGSFNVNYINGTWAESTITHNTAPALGAAVVSNISLATTDKNQYILMDITPALQAWLNGSQSNDGIALVANGTFHASFDSKENTTTSHPPELDVVISGGGTITGVLTGSSSGLTGGGTSGTLNLSLTTACAAKQILQWTGSAWVCSNAGTGTITGLTAGTDLTGGGTSGNVTLSLDTTKVPQLAVANTFTGDQMVNGNLSATGTVTGSSYQIGSNLFAFGSYTNGTAFVGFAGNTTTTGVDNTAAGLLALSSNTSGGYNTAYGAYALQSNSTGGSNTASGANTLSFNTTGSSNTAAGEGALFRNGTGSNNTADGFETLSHNTTASYNTAAGSQALDFNTTGTENTATGYQALYSNSTGSNNTATGASALLSNTTGIGNTASGYGTLYTNTTGNENVASGYQSLYYNSNGVANTGDGAYALLYNTTGSENTAAGAFALAGNNTGTDLTCIGYGCDTGADGLHNGAAIGAHAVVSQSNSLVLGGTGRYAVRVGIGTTAPSNILTIARGSGHPVSDSWETYSSRRWKTNIHTLPNALAKVERLRGVSYDLKDGGRHEIGVVAEEVGVVVPEVVSYEANGKDAKGVDYSRLTALLIEAVKQQRREIAALQAQLRKRTAKQVLLESRLAQLEADRKKLSPVAASRLVP